MYTILARQFSQLWALHYNPKRQNFFKRGFFPHNACMHGLLDLKLERHGGYFLQRHTAENKQLPTELCPNNFLKCPTNFAICLDMMISKQITVWYNEKVVVYRSQFPTKGGQSHCIFGLWFQYTATCSRQVVCADTGLELSGIQSSGTSRFSYRAIAFFLTCPKFPPNSKIVN